jgi:3',5'-cyclic AMP phosphodiesterase CpdA
LCSLISQPAIAENSSFTFIHLSDLHISADPKAGPSALNRLKRALNEVDKMRPRPELIIVTGDIAAGNGQSEAYLKVKNLLQGLKIPVHYARGNHDDGQDFYRYLLSRSVAGTSGAPYHYFFVHKGYRFVVLDSVVPGEPWGRIDSTQLDWLGGLLTTKPDIPTFIFLHHHLKQIGLAAEYPLKNPGELMAVLSSSSKVIAVLSGHAHKSEERRQERIWYLTTLATSYAFDGGGIGYRVVRIENGSIRTANKELGRVLQTWLELFSP